MVGKIKLKQENLLTEEEKYSRKREKLETEIERSQRSSRIMTDQIVHCKLLSDKPLTEEGMSDLQEAVAELRPASDKESERTAGRNLRDIERESQLELREAEVELKEVNGDRYVKEMTVRCVPDFDYPDIMLEVILLTEEDTGKQGDLPTIKQMEASLEGLEEHPDLLKAITYCEENLEPQLLTRLVREYLPLHHQRLDLLTNLDEDYCSLTSDRGDKLLELTNRRGSLLATLGLMIKLNLSQLRFVPLWRCELTDEGRRACSALNIPEELAIKGHLDTWDCSQAVDTLTKVARFDMDETPNKEFNASNVNTDTPICGARKTLAKRKL